MNNDDAKKVVEDLSEKPFLLGENTIETDSGYIITTKQGMKQIRAQAITEFSEKLKREILDEICEVSERQKNYEVGSDMSITYSHIMGALREVHNSTIDKIATELKGE